MSRYFDAGATIARTSEAPAVTPLRCRAGNPARGDLRFVRIGLGALLACTPLAHATRIDIPGPAGSGSFGFSVTVLPNGHIVVVDPAWQSETGAVYRYDETGRLRSTLKGDSPGDRVGNRGITVLSNGHFVVSSGEWDSATADNVGAATWVSGTARSSAIGGIVTVVSASNSLVGSTANDNVAFAKVTALSNGNYVVSSSQWDNGAVVDAGAVTWGNGSTGTVGAVSAANSLVGSNTNDRVGGQGITALGNGHYVVGSGSWSHGAAQAAGAATWCNGTSSVSGVVSAANSLVGTTTGDFVGGGDIVALTNGNYVVRTAGWRNGAGLRVGAATWGPGDTGITGAVSAGNSLVGTTDLIDVQFAAKVFALSNGNYVVSNPLWSNGASAGAGAVTWGNGATGVTGEVSIANSLVGSNPEDTVGRFITPLSNGNYVVVSPYWNHGATQDVGAVTWRSGNAPTGGGVVSAGNSLVGSATNNLVGLFGVVALSNGHYAVNSPFWDNGAFLDVGAVTWGNGVSGTTGAVGAANSLIGASAADHVGLGGVTALNNGNFVVSSPDWNDPFIGIDDAGAATWSNGAIVGPVSSGNSLIGTQEDDRVGAAGAIALSNGHYVVASPDWSRNGSLVRVGALTWGDGSTGQVGAVDTINSLHGTAFEDQIGLNAYREVVPLSDGNYVVRSTAWDNGVVLNAGAVTLAHGSAMLRGAISDKNSVLGTVANGGVTLTFAYDAARERVAVGRPGSNSVVLFDDRLFRDDFETQGLVPLLALH